MIRDINNPPEHPLTLEELNVVVEEEKITVRVFFTTFNTSTQRSLRYGLMTDVV
jgi:hypothetical protein